ncbi:DedA family protein [Desulfitobacterium sp. Sab5]|uniref:DedA family protein n=1 Tax=Desulfitobacterium nosdiversum TaxID=3375356 RepID=UPI003CF7203F
MTFKLTALSLISTYGYYGLYLSLAMGILGLPIPDETILTFTGFYVAEGHLNFALSIFIAFLGSISGMSISFLIGRKIGLPFLQRFGKFLHLTPDRLNTAQVWFDKYKGFSLIFGYFVPGFRHISAYMAGISRLNFLTFLTFASVGAMSWVITFISVGRFVGKDWERIGELFHRNLWFILIMCLITILISYRYKFKHHKIN